MVNKIDTSAEAVERKAAWLETYAVASPRASAAVEAVLKSTAATLRALTRERDAQEIWNAAAEDAASHNPASAHALSTSIDRIHLAAENARLREALLYIYQTWPDSSAARHARASFMKEPRHD